MTAPAKAVPSPCISICSMDKASGLCSGCLRTLDEIAAWSTLDEPAKHAIRQRLSARRAQARRLRQATVKPASRGSEAT